MRYVDWQGRDASMRVSSGVTHGVTDPLSQADLDQQLAALIWINRQAQTLPGVYFTRATVAAKQLPALAADPLVFLSDVTRKVVRDKIVAAGFSSKQAEAAQVDVTPPNPFSQMEEIGLSTFAR